MGLLARPPRSAVRRGVPVLFGVVLAAASPLAIAQAPSGAAAAASGADSNAGPDALKALLDAGRDAFGERRFDDALEAFRRALEIDPRNITALAGRASSIYYRATKTGVSPAQRSRDLAESLRLFLGAADIAMDGEEYALAERLLNQAMRVDPSAGDVMFGLGRLQVLTGRSVQALDTFRNYAQTDTGRIDYRVFRELGKLYVQAERSRLAISNLRRAAELRPRDAEIQHYLAIAYQQDHQLDKASEHAARAVKIEPDNYEYRARYASILLGLNKASEAEREVRTAIDAVRKSLQDDPANVERLRAMADLQTSLQSILDVRIGNDRQNVALMLESARLVQDIAAIGEVLAWHHAEQILLTALKVDPDNVEVLQALAPLQVQIRKLNAARKTCRRLLKLRPDDPLATRLLDELGPPASQPARAAKTMPSQ